MRLKFDKEKLKILYFLIFNVFYLTKIAEYQEK